MYREWDVRDTSYTLYKILSPTEYINKTPQSEVQDTLWIAGFTWAMLLSDLFRIPVQFLVFTLQ